MLTNDASYRLAASEAEIRAPGRYFGAASRSRTYVDSACPSVCPFVRPGSQTEAIRARIRAFSFCHGRNLFVSIRPNLPLLVKKEADLSRSPRRYTPLSPPFCYLSVSPRISNSQYAHLVNWLLRTQCHSSILMYDISHVNKITVDSA